MSLIENELHLQQNQYSGEDILNNFSKTSISTYSFISDEKDHTVVAPIRKKISKQDQLNSDQKKAKKYKNGLKHADYGYRVLMNLGKTQCLNEDEINQLFIYKQVPTQKAFFLAGDIIAELNGRTEDTITDLYIKNRNILQVQYSNDSISIDIESVHPMKQLSGVIYYLENSQDEQSYKFAQFLKIHQTMVSLLNDSISLLKNQYLSSSKDLKSLIYERKQFVKQYKQNIMFQVNQNDEFACITTVSLSFENQTMTVSNMGITKPVIALLGINDKDLPFSLIRMGFVKLYSNNNRKQIFQSNIQAYMKRGEAVEIEIPNFEFKTIDDILISCTCKLQSIPIQYPPHLQFNIKSLEMLDKLECFLMMKFMISEYHIESVINIRKEYTTQSPQNQIFPKNYEYENLIEVDNFEYFMQSEIFLEKFYNTKTKKGERNEEMKYCGYRVIS